MITLFTCAQGSTTWTKSEHHNIAAAEAIGTRHYAHMICCQSCELHTVQGRAVHEAGCPEAWRDLVRECRESNLYLFTSSPEKFEVSLLISYVRAPREPTDV